MQAAAATACFVRQQLAGPILGHVKPGWNRSSSPYYKLCPYYKLYSCVHIIIRPSILHPSIHPSIHPSVYTSPIHPSILEFDDVAVRPFTHVCSATTGISARPLTLEASLQSCPQGGPSPKPNIAVEFVHALHSQSAIPQPRPSVWHYSRIANFLDRDALDARNRACHVGDAARLIPALDHELR